MVKPLDETLPPSPWNVALRTAEHLVNLKPAPAPRNTRLLALPAPYLFRVDAFRRLLRERKERLQRLATRFGGGDGPLEIIDLEEESRPLAQVLETLREQHVDHLHVVDRNLQPGFFRALLALWPGSLAHPGAAPCTEPHELDLIHSGQHPEVRAVDTPDTSANDLVCARGRGPELGPYTGIVPPGARYGTDDGRSTRERWQAYWETHEQPDLVRPAVLGLDPMLDRHLRRARNGAAARGAGTQSQRLFAITGLDGSGKTTHAAGIAEHLASKGHRVHTLKIYRQGGFLDLAGELSARVARGAPLANFRVSRAVKLIDSLRVLHGQLLPAMERSDVLVLDRYVETHVAAAWSQLGQDLRDHPILRAFPPTHLLVLLRLDPEEAIKRLGHRGETLSADEHETGLRGYADAFDRLCRGERTLTLQANDPLTENAAAIERAVQDCLPDASGASVQNPGSSHTGTPGEPLRKASTRTEIAFGTRDIESEVTLGEDVLRLRAWLAETLGERHLGADAFWLEAYVTQALLDVLTRTPERAHMTLDPRVLVRMACFADLEVLREVDRLLRPHIRETQNEPDLDLVCKTFVRLGYRTVHAEHLSRTYGTVR